MTPKENAVAAVTRAHADLEQALAELEKIPALDPASIAFSAHALGNYLTVTGGIVDLLMASLADHANPQVHAWLENLSRATEVMSHTVNQLLARSSLPTAGILFEKVNLALLAQRLCAHYRRSAARKGIHLAFESAADVPPVRADRLALAAVLDNLISNAVKYSEPDGRVWVQVRGEPGAAVCGVRDEGPGLSVADQAKLFQRGCRLTPVPTGGEPSSGYGLAVARELTEALAGQLWCESQLGQGACFWLRLPAYPEETPGPAPGSAGPPR